MIDLRTRIIELLGKYRDAREEARTPLARDLAKLFVAAREQFSTRDGDPDWKGRSYAYRMFVRELYSEADFPRDEAKTAQATVGYHVGELLRDRLPAEQIAELGLKTKSARERNQELRASKSAEIAEIRDLKARLEILEQRLL